MGYWSCFGSWRRRIRSKAEDNSCNSETRMVAKAKNTSESVNRTPEKPSEPERDLSVEPVVSSKVFTFGELAYATENFRDESFIGQGGFGSVYKGKLERTGQVVAVKKLDQTGVQGDREFLVEVLMLSLMRHSNLVNLVGYCAEGNQRLLVYEFMPLGSLESRLHDRSPNVKPLDWNTRMMIAMGTAKGLNYLHNEADPPVIYRDLKSANILLDIDCHPKLSDFGLAKFGPSGDKTHVSTRVMGTHGYCAPEYAITGKLTSKSDIYSFGVVLLELITGRRALDEERGDDRLLVAWARPWMEDRKTCSRLGDPDLRGQVSESVLTKAIEVASMCLRENPGTRPQISDVVLALDFIASCMPKSRKKNKGDRRSADESQNDKTKVQKKDREVAVAEAKKWAEAFRENRRQGPSKDDENITSR